MEHKLELPTIMAGKRDIVRVQRDIEHTLEQILQARIAKAQNADAERTVSAPSPIVKRLFELNKLEMSEETLKRVDQQLESIRQHAPTIRIAFAREPDNEVTAKVVSWFRRSIDPNLLVQIGIQPIIAGGCVVQTPMRRYDFSLRQKLLDSTDKLHEVMSRVS